MNYFELFDLPVSLQVDAAALNRKYVALQKQFHPDFFTQDDEAAQQQALEKSADINKALKVLRNQDATLEYVLQLKGVLEADEKYQLPPDFLMEVMELNEELSDQSATAIAQFEADIYQPIAPLVEQYDHGTVSHEALLQLKEYYFKKKYLQRILDRIDG